MEFDFVSGLGRKRNAKVRRVVKGKPFFFYRPYLPSGVGWDSVYSQALQTQSYLTSLITQY
jgi:hypothetical protein